LTPAGGADDDGRVTSPAGYWIGGGLIGARAIGGVLLAAGVGLIVTTGVRRRRRAAAAPPATEHAGLAGLEG
jgi:hypothetical protein